MTTTTTMTKGKAPEPASPAAPRSETTPRQTASRSPRPTHPHVPLRQTAGKFAEVAFGQTTRQRNLAWPSPPSCSSLQLSRSHSQLDLSSIALRPPATVVGALSHGAKFITGVAWRGDQRINVMVEIPKPNEPSEIKPRRRTSVTK